MERVCVLLKEGGNEGGLMWEMMQKKVLCGHSLQENEINTHKLTFRFAFTLDARDSMAGTDQSAAQVRPFPLVINAIVVTILYTTI